MKKLVWIYGMIGALLTGTALIIEIIFVSTQTIQVVINSGILSVLAFLLLPGAVFFAGAFWKWNSEVKNRRAFILVVVGLVGLGLSIMFWNVLVDIFFPLFLAINFITVVMVGFFLSQFGHLNPISDR